MTLNPELEGAEQEPQTTEAPAPRRRRSDRHRGEAGSANAQGTEKSAAEGAKTAETSVPAEKAAKTEKPAPRKPSSAANVPKGNAATRGRFGAQSAQAQPGSAPQQPAPAPYPPQQPVWPYGPQQASGGYISQTPIPRQNSGSFAQGSGGFAQAQGPAGAQGTNPYAQMAAAAAPQGSSPYAAMPPVNRMAQSGGFAAGQRAQSGAAYPVQPMQSGGFAYNQGSGGMARARGFSGEQPSAGGAGASGRGFVPPSQKPVTPPKKKHTLLKIAAAVVLIAGLAVGGYYGVRGVQKMVHDRQVLQAVEPYDKIYCDNVYVDGIHLGGMTQEEAREAVTRQANERAENWSVRLMNDGEVAREIRTSDLGMSVHVDSALKAAWDMGHQGTNEDRLADMEALKTTPFEDYTTVPGSDTSIIDGILNQLARDFYIAPEDAELTAFVPSATYPFTFKNEVVGRTLNTESIKEELYRMVSSMQSGEIELTPTTVEPNVTVDKLKKTTVALRGKGTTPISSKSEENRNNNIRRAFEQISGTIIHPGQNFSFNNIVGQRTVGNGFFPADEYVYEQVQSGIGGGVCQASSTVYLAAVRAGMKIVHREPHSMAVNYTSFGKDATVYWYSNHKIDLVFKNTTDQDIYITAAVQSASGNRTKLECNVCIYGAGLDGVTYDIVTVDTVIPPPEEPEIIRDKNQEHVIYTDEEYELRKASEGHSVDSYRVTYDIQKNEIAREFLYTDIYKAKARQVMVGTTVREPNN